MIPVITSFLLADLAIGKEDACGVSNVNVSACLLITSLAIHAYNVCQHDGVISLVYFDTNNVVRSWFTHGHRTRICVMIYRFFEMGATLGVLALNIAFWRYMGVAMFIMWRILSTAVIDIWAHGDEKWIHSVPRVLGLSFCNMNTFRIRTGWTPG